MRTISKLGFIGTVAFTMSACSTLYKVDVTAFSQSGEPVGDTYVVLSADPDMDVTSPEFEMHAKQLERAMSRKGFTRVSGDELDKAALGVYVSADISDPSKRYHKVETPIYDSGVSEDLGSAAKNPTDGKGGVSGPGGENKLPPAPLENWEGVSSSGFATTVYTKQLNLVAIDLQRYLKDIKDLGREQASPIEVWSVDVETTGQPDDLSATIPILIAAAEPYIASETGEVVRVNLSETDKRVQSIR